ncbi:hypothetical protein DHL47_09020 [Streptococcus panodentis]|uniref:SdpI family protein n=1 Tax=Streptococcus panodentis TaxID=1581472 RepID=A0ABS5AY53_9STRE|nr:hypothetical protein [Streptococcus panodentis]
MISIYIIIGSLFLWILNYISPNRNAGVGLRFPSAFRTLKQWQQLQSRFYVIIITANILILLYSLVTNTSEEKVIAYSIVSVVISGLISFLLSLKK